MFKNWFSWLFVRPIFATFYNYLSSFDPRGPRAVSGCPSANRNFFRSKPSQLFGKVWSSRIGIFSCPQIGFLLFISLIFLRKIWKFLENETRKFTPQFRIYIVASIFFFLKTALLLVRDWKGIDEKKIIKSVRTFK